MLASHSNSGDDLDGLLEGEPTLLRDLLDGHEQGQIAEPHRRLPGGQGTWPRNGTVSWPSKYRAGCKNGWP